jgi:hypothetical protein
MRVKFYTAMTVAAIIAGESLASRLDKTYALPMYENWSINTLG